MKRFVIFSLSKIAANTKTAMQMIPLNTDGYKWSEEDREYAKENWNN